MPLITPQLGAAALIDSINIEVASYLRAQLQRCYDLLWHTGNPQEVLDALGSNATAALSRYAALYSALQAISEAGTLPNPDLTIYQPQPDGTVIYCPPPAPEPAPTEP